MRFVAADAKATKRPVCATEDCPLDPSAGVVPSGVEIRVVTGLQEFVVVAMVVTHVYRRKTSWTRPGLGAVAPRLVADDVNETYKPSVEMDGCELGPSPGVVPSGVETR